MKRAAWLLALALSACPPAKALAPPATIAANAVDAALREAEAAFGKRPDAAQVREALGRFQAAAAADPTRTEALAGIVRTAAWLLEHGVKEDRRSVVATAVAAGEACQRRAPAAAPCDYWEAVALGLAAREQPLTALGALPKIIALLKRAAAAAPALDEGGPSRVLALLLARAPGWPTGPGNPDDALVAAKRAVALAPTHPLNALAEAEALAATGEADAARAAYQRAAELGAARGDADGAEWAAQAREGLEKLAP